jgi:ribonuclease HI
LYEIYTDGSCRENPGRGGWAALILHENAEIGVQQGFDLATTNNRMELQAVIGGLEAVPENSVVKVYCDSAYVVNCFKQRWYGRWKVNGWTNSSGKPVENKDLWEKLIGLYEVRFVEFIKVKGHSDNELNNRVDGLASIAAQYDSEKVVDESPVSE